MKLPSELRSMVYGYLLQGAENIIKVQTFRKCSSLTVRELEAEFEEPRYDCHARLHHSKHYSEFANQEQPLQRKDIDVAILRVNKACHDEAVGILYQSHSFNFGACAQTAFAFFNIVSPRGRMHIPEVQMELYRTCKVDNEREWCKAVNFMAKTMPTTKLVSTIWIELYMGDGQLMNRPFARSLGRLEGINRLGTDKGQDLVGRINAFYDNSEQKGQEDHKWVAFEWQSR
ncbi:MAG: hypothetical protein Q9225_000523 [Loekoesia sp. 1 TL-2023]